MAINKLTEIKQELTKRDFFRLDKSDFIATRAAVMALVSALSDDDLLFYSEPHTERPDGLVLQELEIDLILYNRSLVIISQPLEKEQSSKIIGSLFWDTLCKRTLELGRQPPLKNGKKREHILAVFDETN